VREILEADAVARDRAGATPYDEVALLKDSGLVTLLGPTTHGRAGQEWPLAYRVVRGVAAGDGSIGQLLGYHYLWFWAARLVGTPEQIAAVEADATRNRWFFGGAVNPRDADVVIRDAGDHLVYNGRKSFSTGSKVSDVTVLEGVYTSKLWAVEALADQVAEVGLAIHRDAWNVTEQQRGEHEVRVAG
jgi:alkylation response protein AidB-like acyl-CoA dehydrogenase